MFRQELSIPRRFLLAYEIYDQLACFVSVSIAIFKMFLRVDSWWWTGGGLCLELGDKDGNSRRSCTFDLTTALKVD